MLIMKLRPWFVGTVMVSLFISAFPQISQASTPRAWSYDSLSSINSDEVRASFGDRVYAIDMPNNWSIRSTPTSFASKFNPANFSYAIPACNSKIKIGCIESVRYRKSNGQWKVATLSSYELPNRSGEMLWRGRSPNTGEVTSEEVIGEWPADMEKHAPAAGRASYWNFNGAPHGGGSDYLVKVAVRGETSAKPIFSTWSPTTNTTRQWKNGIVQRFLEMAIFPANGITEYEFPENLEIKVRVKLGTVAKDLWGWFDGRVINPEIILDFESSDGILEVSGSPAKIPIGLTPSKKVGELSKEFSARFDCPAGILPSYCPRVPAGYTHGISTDGNSEISNFDSYEKEFGLVSTVGYKTAWWVKTTAWPDVINLSDCPVLQSGFMGIVTTNATMYSTAAPTWDPSDKSFSFQVASPHSGLNGELNKGFYSLIIPKQIAECVWGQEIAKAKVVVSIISTDGVTNAGVSNYSIRDNLISFNISGFTYSSPKIKVGLAAQPTAQPIKKTSITCIKGKESKKVTALKPTCPKGYKKK